MIKVKNIQVTGLEPAIRGMRNPMNSWDKSDSFYDDDGNYILGFNDHKLAMQLAKGGGPHAKYRRMINAYMDITAPIYIWSEIDTYKVGTVRNSCSFMHKGVEKPFDITDFSIKDERVYEAIKPLELRKYDIIYPYETDEYKTFTDNYTRTYRVYRNGRIIREAFDYTDTWGTGRNRHFEETPATMYQNKQGYIMVKFSGRNNGFIPLHRMVLLAWNPISNPDTMQVNHINGNKGDNSLENLEWVTASENMRHAYSTGLYDNSRSWHRRYAQWKSQCGVLSIESRFNMLSDYNLGMTVNELSSKYGITEQQIRNIIFAVEHNNNEELFQLCHYYESMLNHLNDLREQYIITKDYSIFQEIRCLLPMGYMQKATCMFNYETISEIIKWRYNHKLDEWREFCDILIRNLPYPELFAGERLQEMTDDSNAEKDHTEGNAVDILK